jgi:membrane dipeptidase
MKDVIHAFCMRSPVIDFFHNPAVSPEVFAQLGEGQVDAVHATIVCHERFREIGAQSGALEPLVRKKWRSDSAGGTANDIRRAVETRRTAIFAGFVNPSAIEDDIGLVEVCNQAEGALQELAASGGVLGFSPYPHHLAGGSSCTSSNFLPYGCRLC